jgi:uncharacterized membrane protein
VSAHRRGGSARLWRFAMSRRRLFGAIAAALIAYAGLTAFRFTSRSLIAWDVFAGTYMILATHLAATTGQAGLRKRAKRQDDGRVFVLWLTIGAACFSVAAIFQELAGLKDMPASLRAQHLGIAAATIVLSWMLIHMSFALHYAHDYFDADERTKSGYRGGLDFPGGEPPDYWDFIHFSYTIGVAAQTADIQILSKRMRRLVTLHAIIAFAFNTTMIALAVNIAASLA